MKDFAIEIRTVINDNGIFVELTYDTETLRIDTYLNKQQALDVAARIKSAAERIPDSETPND